MMDVFNSIEDLEPKCSLCKIILLYGQNTIFNEEHQYLECGNCHAPID